MAQIRFIRCTWKRPQGSPERRGGPGPNGSCTSRDSARMRARHRRIFAAAAKARRPCRPHFPARSLSAPRSCSRRTTPSLRRFSGCFGPCRLIRCSATGGRGCSQRMRTTLPRRSHKSCDRAKSPPLSTNWPVRASIHTRSCCGPLPVAQDCGRCWCECPLPSGMPLPASLKCCRGLPSPAIRSSSCRSTPRPRRAGRDFARLEFLRDRLKKSLKRCSSITKRKRKTTRIPGRSRGGFVTEVKREAAAGFVVSPGHLPLAMRFQQREQALAHDESRPIRGHVHLDLASDVDDGIGVGGLQYLAILLNDGRVPGDQFLRGTVLFSIIAEQDLHQLDAAVVDRGCRIENDMPQPGRVLDIERPAEGHEPGVAHVTLGDGLACAGHAKGGRWIVDGNDRLGLEAVIGFHELVFFRLGLIELSEGRFVNEGEVRVVE